VLGHRSPGRAGHGRIDGSSVRQRCHPCEPPRRAIGWFCM